MGIIPSYTKVKYYTKEMTHIIFILMFHFGHMTWDFGQIIWGQIKVKYSQIKETCVKIIVCRVLYH